MNTALSDWFAEGAARFDAELAALLDAACPPGRLRNAMHYGVLSGGKRLRPYLVLEGARLLGGNGHLATRTAAALEFIHCYSLVHDDLPAMDNDDMRRGRPTVHRAYDDATAILVGDALLTLAFELIAEDGNATDAAIRLRLSAALAKAAGAAGMVGGQMLDLAAEGRFGQTTALDAASIIRLQGMKTGALIVFAATAGALMQPDVNSRHLAALREYGDALGLAFQIRDDLIDVEVDAATAGKATGKDSAAGKGTFVTLLGVEGARSRLAAETQRGIGALADFGKTADPLCEALIFNASRTS